MLRTAAEWDVIETVPCSIKMLPTTKSAASFHDFEEYERLVEAARSDLQTYLVVLFGGEAGMRCGEIMALEWTDVDLNKRQLCVARSEWKGHVTVPKSGRLRYVPLTQKVVQVMMRWVARRANVTPGVHILRHHADNRIMPTTSALRGAAVEIARFPIALSA